ncbi:uncharacterized protein [Oryza sativa Japonica Group]|uniref:uncharacterized protein n=1 Tax=Oryza sativa subsp. japonica TaxID=39947 RepID=UPI0007755020|nr:stress response protein NST1 [Oryza sativa Japonica Group]
MVFGDYFRRRIVPLQERSRGTWEYTGPNDPMRTHVGERWDWGEDDAKTVIRRVLGLDTAEQTLIPDRILPICSDRDRESILAVMSAVGAGRGRSRRGSAVGMGSSGATVLATADSTVREGLNAQVQAPAEERAALEAEWAQLVADRARVDEGRRAVDDMVEVGRKMRQAQLAEIQTREEAALITSSILDEALGDIRLQYEAYAKDLTKRVENACGVIDAAAAQERRASEADASLRARTAALEAERKALDERARSAQEFEATVRRRIEVLDRNQREQDARSREQAQRAQELEEQAQALEEQARLLDQRESTLAAHERTATEAEASLRLREEAAAERDQTTLAAKASAARRVEELRLREEACRERDAALAERKAEGVTLGEQLAEREEAVTGREARHLESARAERAAMAARASKLEGREKDLAAGG